MCDDKGIDNCGDGSDLEENLTTGCKGQLSDGVTFVMLIFKGTVRDFLQHTQNLIADASQLSFKKSPCWEILGN